MNFKSMSAFFLVFMLLGFFTTKTTAEDDPRLSDGWDRTE